jgi:hypothetical protein
MSYEFFLCLAGFFSSFWSGSLGVVACWSVGDNNNVNAIRREDEGKVANRYERGVLSLPVAKFSIQPIGIESNSRTTVIGVIASAQ